MATRGRVSGAQSIHAFVRSCVHAHHVVSLADPPHTHTQSHHRSRHFCAAHASQRSVEALSVTQLYELKNEVPGGNRALHAQALQQLRDKPPAVQVQLAAVSHSPLVTSALSSPLVARSRVANTARSRRQGHSRLGSTHGAVVALAGPHAAAATTPSICPPLPVSGGKGRASVAKPLACAAACLPEVAGLPPDLCADEGFAYLCLLRRSVLHGPTLGLPTAAAGPTRGGMASSTGAAPAAGVLSNCSSVVFGRG